MFQLSPEEKIEVVAHCDHLTKLKFSKALPHAFTEHGAIMAEEKQGMKNEGKSEGRKS